MQFIVYLIVNDNHTSPVTITSTQTSVTTRMALSRQCGKFYSSIYRIDEK